MLSIIFYVILRSHNDNRYTWLSIILQASSSLKHDGFHCFCCCRSPWSWLWSVPLLEDMLNFKVHTDTGHHIEVCFLSWHWRSHWYLSSYLPQETLFMSQIISVIPASLCGNINMSVSNCQWNLYWYLLSIFSAPWDHDIYEKCAVSCNNFYVKDPSCHERRGLSTWSFLPS